MMQDAGKLTGTATQEFAWCKRQMQTQLHDRILPEIYMAISIRRLPSSTSTTAIYCCYLLQINAAQRWTWLRSFHGLGWVDFFGNCRGLGGVGFNDIVMGWVQRLRQMRTACKTLNFIPRTLNS